MDIQKQADPELAKLAELIGDTKFAMLTTEEPDGTLRARPLATLRFDSQAQLWFFTGASSPKMTEIAQHRQVCLTYARIDKQDFVSVSGVGELVRDRELMRELWTPWIKPWFPNGLDDPDLALLKVGIVEAEYWDAPGNAVHRYYGLAKALAGGGTDALGEHGKVRVGPTSV